MRSLNPAAPGHQEQKPYSLTRESPCFNGLLKGNDLAPIFDFPLHGRIGSQNLSPSTSDIGDRKLHSNMSGKVMGSPSPFEDSASHNNILEPFDFDFQGIFDSQNISRSTSDIGDMRNTKIVSKISEEVMESPLEDSISDIIFEPFDEQPSSGRWSKIVLSKPFEFPSSTSDLNLDLSSQNDAVYGPSLTTFEENDEYNTSHDQAMLAFEKSYSMEKRKQNLSNIPLPQSAATFYNGISPEMEICESINRLNNYLRGRKDDVKAGVPGKFLQAVIRQDISGIKGGSS